MRLSTKSLYGVRAVFDIAYNSSGAPVQIKNISKRQKISARYLEQIFKELRKIGVLKSKRGPHGGYYLARTPGKITVGDILRATEGPPELVFCTGDRIKKECGLLDRCVTRPIWQEACLKLMDFFDSVSIQDLCKRGEGLGIKKEGSCLL
ncbi:MAG: RrF2 family transcriptional regulator [Thermodesulfobacteriota bacterium]